jgi:hypothetical protein
MAHSAGGVAPSEVRREAEEARSPPGRASSQRAFGKPLIRQWSDDVEPHPVPMKLTTKNPPEQMRKLRAGSRWDAALIMGLARWSCVKQ